MSTLASTRHHADDFTAAQELYHERGWTDGLPVVPPTPDAVGACLDWVLMPPDQLIGVEPVRGRPITIESKEGKAVAPASLLWGMQRQDFPLVGYDLSLDGWRDPVKFLREHQAHTNPARYRLKRR